MLAKIERLFAALTCLQSCARRGSNAQPSAPEADALSS
jgi:hypothetical protein